MALLQHFFPKNSSFSFEALRAAGYAPFGAADVGEVIAICSRIPSGDEDSWLREWKAAGDRAVTNAKASLASGNRPSARDAFLRASNYYRTAEFYRRENPHEDLVAKTLSDLSARMFYQAAELMPYITERITIPYENTTLPGTLMRPDNTNTPRPTIIVNGGYDSTREETVWGVAASALELGYNVLAFDGPGQGETVREQRLYFRPDWENVLTPVVDYTLAQPFVDSKKLVIVGISMGGYLVSRAACFEHRAAAIILNDGLYDFGASFRAQSNGLGRFLLKRGWDKTLNKIIRFVMQFDTGMKWGILNGKFVFGLTSEADVSRAGDAYTLEGIVHQIKTPTLVLDAIDDHFMGGQPKELYDRLQCDKVLVVPSSEEGATAHCHMGASSRLNQVMFDYLQQRLGLH